MAMNFDGTGTKRVSPGSPAVLDNIFTGGGTVMAWFTLDGFGAGSFGKLLSKSLNLTPNDAWFIQAQAGDSQFSFAYGFSTMPGQWDTDLTFTADGRLYHIAIAYDNSSVSNDPIIYVDGTSESITENSTPVGTADSDAAQDFLIGNQPVSFNRAFDGNIEDVRLYNRILSAAEIQTIYVSKGIDGIFNGLVGRWVRDEGAPGVTASGASTNKDLSENGNHGTPTSSPVYAVSTIKKKRKKASLDPIS